MPKCLPQRIRSLRPTSFLAALAAALVWFAHPAGAADGSWRGRGPAEGGWGPTGIYDPVRQRMVVFGGQWHGEVTGNSSELTWELSLNGTPAWTALTTFTDGPFGRQAASGIYDPVRDRMIIYGGEGSPYFGDVWALSLSGPPTWTQLNPLGGPGLRQGHTAIYDPVRDRMLVFGGNDQSHVDHNDVWALSLSGTPTWTKLTPSGTPPPTRGWHSAIYDPVRDRMVIYGGYMWSTTGSLGDTWALSLSGTPTWSPLTASGSPGARNSHSAIYDPAGDRMIVYGGWNDPGHPENLTVLSFSGSPAWSILAPSGTPPTTRDGQTMVYDAPRQRVVIYGGGDEASGNVFAATLSGSPAWSAIAPVALGPRGHTKTIYDPVRDRMIAVMGSGIEIWARNLGGEPTWTQLVTSGAPPGRGQLAICYDSSRDRLVTHGGSYSDEIWVLPLTTLAWAKLEPLTAVPPMRWAHTATYDPVRDRMVVFGGGDGGHRLNEVWVYSFTTSSWVQIMPGGTEPVGRYGHTAVYDPFGDRIVICGGYNGVGPFSRDVWSLSLSDFTWTEILPTNPLPHDVVWMSAVFDNVRRRMLMFGGMNPQTGDTNELWSLALTGTPDWTLLTPSGRAPVERQEHDAIYDPVRDRMVVFGGSNGYTFHDVWEYSPPATASVPDVVLARGSALAFGPPRPNPSHDATALSFMLGVAGRTKLEVFDAAGRRVRRLLDTSLSAGPHVAVWRGDDDRGRMVGPGLYFARLQSGKEQATRRVLRIE